MNQSFPVVQVVGYKNSGKTTLVCKMVQAATTLGIKVATCKHHGHGGAPSVAEGTDSVRHEQAGAVASGVEGDGTFQLSIHKQNWDLKTIFAFYKLIELDLLILEGFKQESFPKIVLLRKEEDVQLLNELENIIAVISTYPISHKNKSIPYFRREDDQSFIEWYRGYLKQILHS